MGALRIVVDDACEVPAALAARLGIAIVPLVVRFGEQVWEDGSLSLDDFWAKKRTPGLHPQTSQPAPGTFAQVFQRIVEAGDDVLCITITSKHSGTHNSAWLAAQQFPGKVTVFDSLSVAWGSGFLAVRAAEDAAAGKSLTEILQTLEALRKSVQFPILLNTLEDLRKGGRADRLIPVLDKVLRVFDIKPLITFIDGDLKVLGTVRSYERGLGRLLDLAAEHAPYQNLAVWHSRQPEAALAFAERVAERLAYPREKIFVTEVGPLLATHAGEKAMAIIGVPVGVCG